jgi:NADH:ubiquinone reductase (H+-translocating)
MKTRQKVIVVGGGFAGIQVIRKLDPAYFDVLLIDKLNHHQFQPLFYQVATSQLEPSSISFPLRNIFKRSPNVQIRLAEVLNVEVANNFVKTTIGGFHYDILIIAIGCTTNFFGNKNLSENTFTLKTTHEAIAIRNHILETFEKIISANETEKESLNNLVIVGAGPTGVELAGAFAEIKKFILPKDYPRIDFSRFKIILIEGSKNTLNTMSEFARRASNKYLNDLGISVYTNTIVKDYDGNTLSLNDGTTIATKTVIWAAGVIGNSLQGIPTQALLPNNRMVVNRINQVKDCTNVYAVGDIAMMETPLYPKGHPQVANVAINQAKNLARNLKRMANGKQTKDYEYRDLGSMATIGTNKAVVDLPFVRFKGYVAWLVWTFLHLMLILSVKNKLIIFINWVWAYITKDTSLRLILKQTRNNPE